jgi:hypothetical protein
MTTFRTKPALAGYLILICTSFLWAQGLYIEAETITHRVDWIIDSTYPRYTGTGYLAYTGPSNRNQNDAMAYTFNIETAGRYWIQLRCRRDMDFQCPARAADDECNDAFSKVDNEAWEKTMIKRAQYGDDDGGSGTWGNWFWDGRLSERTTEPRPIHLLSAGNHTYSIASRSPGVKIDAIAIFLEGNTRPNMWTSNKPQTGGLIHKDDLRISQGINGINVTLPAQSSAKLYDISGKVVKNLSQGDSKTRRVTMNTGTSGIYLLMVNQSKSTSVHKVVVFR